MLLENIIEIELKSLKKMNPQTRSADLYKEIAIYILNWILEGKLSERPSVVVAALELQNKSENLKDKN